MSGERPAISVLRRLDDLPIPKKLALIIAVPFCVVLVLLVLSVGGFTALSGIRAYVGGESLYSKAQKNAVNLLDRYARSGDPRDYQRFERSLAVALGDQAARLDLEKPDYDVAAATRAFVQGRNDPDDIPAMIALFRWGRHIGPIDHAIGLWAQADMKINALRAIGGELHREMVSGAPAQTRVGELLVRANALNAELTRLEDAFSSTLGEAARRLKSLLLMVMLSTTLLVSALGIALARIVARRQIGEIDHLKQATVRVAQGDFSQPIAAESWNEIGQLAMLFGEMAAGREQAENALEKESRFVSAVLENISDGIVACDERGTLTLFNRATREFHGLPEQPLPPEQWSAHYDLYLADGRTPMPTAQIPLFRAFNGETIHNVELVIAPKTLPRRTLLCEGQLLITPTGKKLGAMVVMHDITARKQHEAAQQKSLAEKEVLLQEIHHRVKNNLQVIYSLLDLQASNIRDEATISLFRDAQARVHAMALIHQTLYQSHNFAAVDLGAYLQSLLNDFAATHMRPEISMHTRFGAVLLDVQSAVPCGLLINELLTNAYKHAFPGGRGGTLTVELSQSDGDVQLVVADDGVGLAQDARTRGTLGMKLVEILAEQLHARLEYSGKLGTCATLSFSIRGSLTDTPARDTGA